MQPSPIAFERPKLDQEMRPAYVRMPDAVRFKAQAGRSRVVVRVARDVVEQHLDLDRPAQWRDFDRLWPQIEHAAERLIRDGRFGERDELTGLPVVVVGRRELEPRAIER